MAGHGEPEREHDLDCQGSPDSEHGLAGPDLEPSADGLRGLGRQRSGWGDPVYPQLHMDIHVADVATATAGLLTPAGGAWEGGAWCGIAASA